MSSNEKVVIPLDIIENYAEHIKKHYEDLSSRQKSVYFKKVTE